MGSSLSPIRGYSYCSYNKLCFFNQWPTRVTMSWPVYWWSLWLYPYPHWPKKMSLCSRPHSRVSTIIILKSFTRKWLNVHIYLLYCSINFGFVKNDWFFFISFIYSRLQTEFMKISNLSYHKFPSTDSAVHMYVYVYIHMYYRKSE